METIRTTDYGICLYSVSQLKTFMKDIGKSRVKKLLPYFQKNHDVYLRSLSEGAWLPIVSIDSIAYEIKISNALETFDNKWEQLYSYDGFYLKIGTDNAVWISALGKLWNFDENEYTESVDGVLSYKTLDGKTINSACKYMLNKGCYSVTIAGYKKKDGNKSGFLFTFNQITAPINYKDPRRDDIYQFNIINME